MSPQTFTVLEVKPGYDDWEDNFGGENRQYTLELQEIEGVVQHSRRRTSNAPQVGETIWGHLEPSGGTYPPKLKRDQGGPDQPAGAPQGSAQRSSGGQRRSSGRSPDDTAAIQRQHSQEMALRFCEVQARLGQINEEFTMTYLQPLIDTFDDDIAQGVSRASGKAAVHAAQRGAEAPQTQPAQTYQQLPTSDATPAAVIEGDPGSTAPPPNEDDIPF
jgi:hypothetical protein